MPKHRAILIAGPTASGKSAVALELARARNGIVINADSMQVYRDLRILSARPGEADEASAPHALYGFVPAAQAYSVGQWVEDAGKAIARAERDGLLPVITGGTGLYFKALLEGLSPIPDISGDIRLRWRETARDKSAGELHALLGERDPVMAARLKPSDPQRVVRALEVLDATGRSLGDWQKEAGAPLLDEARVARILISPPRELLYERIDARFDTMIAQGALDEVSALAKQRLSPDLPAMRARGVAALMDHLDGIIGLDDAREHIKTETRRYAKRQMTWARSNMIAWKPIFKKDIESLMAEIFAFIDV